MGPDAMIFLNFSLSSFTIMKRLFSSSSFSAITLVSSAYLRLLIFLLAILIAVCDSSSLALVLANTLLNNTTDQSQSTHGHHQSIFTEIRLIIFFAVEDGETLYNQKKTRPGTDCGSIMSSLLKIQAYIEESRENWKDLIITYCELDPEGKVKVFPIFITWDSWDRTIPCGNNGSWKKKVPGLQGGSVAGL